MTETKILIAYFSREGNNYVNGGVTCLSKGNTEAIAEKLQGMTGGDLFRIDTVKSYPADYHETTAEALKEQRENARPKLKTHVADMEKYKTVFLGYPNWWGTMPMAVCAFLEEYDFAGKTLIPFCTHEGSGLGHSERDLKKLCAGAAVLPGLAIQGGSVARADKDLNDWLNGLKPF